MRRQVLVTYDIADDRRRTRVAKTMEAHGDRVQYSVFMCQLDRAELARLSGDLRCKIHHVDDQVLFVDLGPVESTVGVDISCIGKPYSPPARVLVV
jgi:CRISPR-associated protein Cas2